MMLSNYPADDTIDFDEVVAFGGAVLVKNKTTVKRVRIATVAPKVKPLNIFNALDRQVIQQPTSPVCK